jgi:hypothetical protein
MKLLFDRNLSFKLLLEDRRSLVISIMPFWQRDTGQMVQIDFASRWSSFTTAFAVHLG